MYQSLLKHCPSFQLYVIAFDDITFDYLQKNLHKNLTAISLAQFEDEKLISIKSTRSASEYCWTCTASTVLYCLQKFELNHCVYIDADLCFYSNPQVLFNEWGDKSVLITEHRYTPQYDQSELSGIYCVQFVGFKNNAEGLETLNYWRNACIDWCYAKAEDGKFGDQKYLDDWTTRFKGVHVLQHLGGGLASWNVEQWPFVSKTENEIIFKDTVKNSNFEAVFYHFHHVRFFKNDIVDLGWRHPTMPVVANLYVPYIIELGQIEERVKSIDHAFNIPLQDFKLIKSQGFKNKIKYLIKVFYRYNVFNTKKIIAKYGNI